MHLRRAVMFLAVIGCGPSPAPSVKVEAPRPAPSAPAASAEVGIRLTRPASARDAHREELDYLEQLVDLWWAARDRHREIHKIDVHATFADARSLAARCDDLPCYANVVRTALCRLGDGHLRLEPEWWLPTKRYHTGLRVEETPDGAIVVKGNGSVHAGDRLKSIGFEPFEERLRTICETPGSTLAQRRLLAFAALGERTSFGEVPPAPLELHVVGRDGALRLVTVPWEASPSAVSARVRTACVESRILDKKRRIGLLSVRTFWCDGNADAFKADTKRAATALGTVDHLIVDVRDNGGGLDEPARWLASLLVRERTEWMRFRHPRPYAERSTKFFRDHVDPAPDKEWEKLRSARQWALIGPGCFSTCDTFASAIRGAKIATFVGRATAGGVGNPTRFRLPYSGLTVSIPVSLYAVVGSESSDELLEGLGTWPHEHVFPTTEQVEKGEDAALQMTLSLIP